MCASIVLHFLSAGYYILDCYILDCFNPLDIYPGGYLLYMGDTLNCDTGVRVNTVSPKHYFLVNSVSP